MKLEVMGTVLDIRPSERQNIGASTPQTAFIKSHWNDIVSECGAISAVCERIWRPSSILDAMAGCGFSAAVFRHFFPDAELRLNDMDEGCASILRRSFPKTTVTQHDFTQWDFPSCDLAFVDFNNFTFHKSSVWMPALIKLSGRCRELMITDSACYGFRFGNLKNYGVKDPDGYYRMLEAELGPSLNKRITKVGMFGNAAVTVWERTDDEGLVQLASKKINIRKLQGFFS